MSRSSGSRKLVVGFRTLLDEVCVAWADAGENVGARGEDQERFDREATRARRKLERLVLNALLPANIVTRHTREGFSAPPCHEWLDSALQALAAEARMEGRRFTSGHASDYTQRNARRAPRREP